MISAKSYTCQKDAPVGDSPAVLTSIPGDEAEKSSFLALSQARVITLCPISATEVSRYLLDGTATDQSSWKELTTWIMKHPRSALAQALSSPLITWLAKATYAADSIRTSVERASSADELMDTARFPDPDTIERYLLSHLAVTVFERRKSSPGAANIPVSAFRPEQTERWLAFLASRSMRRIVAFWEIRNYVPLFKISLLLAALTGLGIALVGQKVSDFAGPAFLMLLAGCIFGFGWSRGYSNGRARADDPTRLGYEYVGQRDGSLFLHSDRLAKALTMAGVAYSAGLITQIASAGRVDWLFGLSLQEFAVGTFFAVALCYFIANLGARLAAWILVSRPEIDAKMGARAGDPIGAIRSDKRSGVAIFALSSITLAAGDSIYCVISLPPQSFWTVALAPIGAIIATFMWDEWICFKVAHIWLVCRGRLPWQLTSFLQECHDGGILRKVGNYFEFRHRRLQETLAEKGV